jgi:hypothetical protein
MRNGTRPISGELIAENRGWLLYRVSGVGSEWVKVKLVSKVPRQRANFTLAWSVGESALARCKEAAVLDGFMPEVFDWVIEVLRK